MKLATMKEILLNAAADEILGLRSGLDMLKRGQWKKAHALGLIRGTYYDRRWTRAGREFIAS